MINTNKSTNRTAKADSTVESPVYMDFEEKLPEAPPQDVRPFFVVFVITLLVVLMFLFFFAPVGTESRRERAREVSSVMRGSALRGLRARVGCTINRRPAKQG